MKKKGKSLDLEWKLSQTSDFITIFPRMECLLVLSSRPLCTFQNRFHRMTHLLKLKIFGKRWNSDYKDGRTSTVEGMKDEKWRRFLSYWCPRRHHRKRFSWCESDDCLSSSSVEIRWNVHCDYCFFSHFPSNDCLCAVIIIFRPRKHPYFMGICVYVCLCIYYYY